MEGKGSGGGRRYRRAAWAAVAVAAAAATLSLGGRAPKEVATAEVSRGALLRTVVATGRVETLALVSLGATVTGTVSAVHAREGDAVRAGQPLVSLDDRTLSAEVARAEAALASAEARLAQFSRVGAPLAEQAVAQAEANLRNARLRHDRARSLLEAGVAPRADLDEAARALEVAEAQLAQERARLAGTRPEGGDEAVARAAVAEARAARAAAAARLADARIVAPAAGRIVSRSVEAGDAVVPGKVLLVLSRPGDTRIVAPVDEKNLSLLREGQAARAVADAFPDRPFRAVVRTIVPAVDRQRGSVDVRLAVPDPPPFLLPDMTVSVEIEAQRLEGVVTVPAEALSEAGGEPRVRVVLPGGRLATRAVRAGARGSGGAVEVRGGLAPGERVVVPFPAALRDGDRVRPAARP